MTAVSRNFPAARYQLNSATVIALTAVYLIVFTNYTFWSSLFSVVDTGSPVIWLFLFACFSVIFAICVVFFAVFGVAHALKGLLIFVIILASVTSYYMDAYGTVFDDVMVLNIVETNIHEAADLFEPDILMHVLLYGVLPVLILLRIEIVPAPLLKSIQTRLILIIVSVTIAVSSVYLSYKDFTFVFRENREISFFVNPVYPIRAVYRYAERIIRKHNRKFLTVFNDAHASTYPVSSVNAASSVKKTRPDVLILVVGETARAENFHIDGYARNTTPEIEKRNVINFSDVHSCGTATAVSVPCLFSDVGHDDFDHHVVRNRQNLLDALAVAGLQVLWVENNPDCKSVCDRIETYQIEDIYSDEFCNEGRCYDDVLFNGMDKYISRIKKNTVIVLHIQGSHGPAYYKRYPGKFQKFLPECRHSAVQDCTAEEVVNAYDNTILYTDHFLARVIDYLEEKSTLFNAAMLYVSDHGESLGEHGVFLHGLPYMMAPDYQTHVPMIFWSSQRFSVDKNLDESCLKRKSTQHLSHDNLVHSVLGLMDVSSSKYDVDQDIFSTCRKHII